MTAAVALAGFALAALLASLVAWLVARLVRKTDTAAATTVAAGATQLELERAGFERDVEREARLEAERIAEHLAEELRHALANPTLPPGHDLAPGDVDNRVLRFYERFAAARRARGEVPPGGAGALHPGDAAVAGGPPAAGGGRADPADGAGER